MRRACTVLAVVTVLAGCGDGGEDAGAAGGDGARAGDGVSVADTVRRPAGEADVDTAEAVAGPVWTLHEMWTDGESRPLVEGSTITLQLGEAHRVTGHAGVNRYTTEYATDERGRLVWPEAIATTKMAGPPALMVQEAAFLEALRHTDTILLEKDRVVFDGESVRLVFR